MEDYGFTFWDLLQFSDQLRSEHLFISCEQTSLRELNSKVVQSASQLAQLAWIKTQQRINLDGLIMSKPDCSPDVCCLRANTLDQTQFIDAKKVLGYQESSACGKLFNTIRQCPKLLAACLTHMDTVSPDKVPCLVNSIISGLYANCLIPQDELNILILLRHLTILQLLPCDDPRRLLRHSTCAFSRVYSAFLEGLFPAKVFLTAALHEPIMKLLMEDDNFLDIDPDKARDRFPQDERLRLFGVEGSAEYQMKVQRYRQWSINKLCKITKRFIDSLFNNISCFPSCLSWLIKHIYTMLSSAQNIPEKEVFTISMDLIFTYFICPAIVNPEPYGITEASISYVARFNLIQVAQLLQMLALKRYQETDPKLEDIYSQFEKDSVPKFLDVLLNSVTEDLDEKTVLSKCKNHCIDRFAMFFTETELNTFVSMLDICNNFYSSTGQHMEIFSELKPLLDLLPESFLMARLSNLNNNVSLAVTPVDVPKKLSLLNKVNRGFGGSSTSVHISNDSNDDSGEEEHVLLEKCPKAVLVFPLDSEYEVNLGFHTEEKVLAMERTEDSQSEGNPNRGNDDLEVTKSDVTDGKDVQEKRTRFSLDNTNDVGNASDNLDVASEAASNHSASSLELENDNLSDMVSANVSGRGSPNISGRDTPSSQLTEGDEAAGNNSAVNAEPRFVPIPPPVKQPRFDLDDKFGKFDIKTIMGGERDETVSMVSDTWSTDALASDAENIDQQAEQRGNVLQPLQPEHIAPSALLPQMLDTVSETASEAWSTDVAASDSERLIEVETDDTVSVARSDDTARSEVESRGELETEDTGSVSGASIRSGRSGRDLPIPTPMKDLTNVTGQGGGTAEYRRRTFEFVDNNRRDFCAGYSGDNPGEAASGPSTSKTPEKALKIVDVKFTSTIFTSVTTTSQRTTFNSMSHHQSQSQSLSANRMLNFRSQPSSSSQEVSIEDDKGVCLSTVSLASSGSSGSESRAKSSEGHSPPVANGSIPSMSLQASSSPFFVKSSIPKSISFDKSADKDITDEDSKNKKGFLRNFKPSFFKGKAGRGKVVRGSDDLGIFETGSNAGDNSPLNYPNTSNKSIRRVVSEENKSQHNDTSDDILAKYRKKPVVTSDTVDISQLNGSISQVYLTAESGNAETGDPEFSPFDDAKKKLRLVLSSADSSVPLMRNMNNLKDNILVSFLQVQLAEAINLQDRTFIAQLHETLRCVKTFDNEGIHKLFDSMKEEYKGRAPYIAYLLRCRQALLLSISYIERLSERVKCDKDVGYKFLVSICVRLFLEKQDSSVNQFTEEFKQLTLPDEKNDLLDNFLSKLYEDLEKDPIFYYSNIVQLDLARIAIDRAVISRCYIHAMYPNGDGDISRDQVLYEHMKNLAKIITPNHKDLRIPKMFHSECPWPSAQAQISAISSYKTAHDKVQCVCRTMDTIVNLLSLASRVPAADDLVPVLVYVLIKANPPSLLSTVQYVNSFYANKMEGEVQYWWVQFCSAIEFIKTMDYNE
uniref:Receptor-mediated endocytosis protein 6 homolog n=1 Tax=Cacopsylla melanoneura TaxID=428564 RepID=A0A8D8YPM9_9HEMI